IYIAGQIKLLQSHDSVYQEFLRKASLRFENGESNLLEKSMASLQRGQIRLQLNSLNTSLELLQLRLQYLLNSPKTLIPVTENIALRLPAEDKIALWVHNPMLKILAQDLAINKVRYKLASTLRLPEVSAGYLFQTMRSNPTLFTGNYLSYVQLGLNMPLFQKSLRNKMSAILIQDKIIETGIELKSKQLQSQILETQRQYQNYDNKVKYYEDEALTNADQILRLANLQYNNGEINYMEWVLFMDQVITIQSEYQEALYKLNESVINYNYLIATE
ncbi:MAG: TolC family protein, partial [Chitinophagaceae bacterium]|nr:TolC family protein [Chitinophagaceae bacterium]